VITVRSLRKAYTRDEQSRVEVLSGLDLEVPEGELLALVGPPGAGKSTLLNIIGGLDTEYDGEVEVAGLNLGSLGEAALAAFRNRTVGFVFQSFNLLAPLTALENVLLPSYFGLADGEKGSRARALEELERVGLSHKAGQRPPELSGGERQRVAIARALLARPRLLLCDEPTGNLDAQTGAEIIDLFVRRVREERFTVLVVTHEERVCRAADRVLQLRQGRLLPDASQKEAAP
jgi:putative ABC transport system ATP-binding protein